MKALITMLAGLYCVSLAAFLMFIRKGFLQMKGEECMPSIDVNCDLEETTTNDEQPVPPPYI